MKTLSQKNKQIEKPSLEYYLNLQFYVTLGKLDKLSILRRFWLKNYSGVDWVKQSATQQSLGNVGFRSLSQPTQFKVFGANPSVLISNTNQ